MKASILFVAYNQAPFVAEALRSAMAQDYADLELVVCDDASTDATRSIMEEELKGCPSHISIIRAHSERNVGLVANFNRGIAACSGDFVVAMAGDDVSLPSRVSMIAGVFEGDPECMLVFSNWTSIGASGEPLGDPMRRQDDGGFEYGRLPTSLYAGGKGPGSTAAYRSIVASTFGPLQLGTHIEDRGYWMRALLLGRIRYLGEPLVKWRFHGVNLSRNRGRHDCPAARKRILRNLLQRQNYSRQLLTDVNHAISIGLVDGEFAGRLTALIRQQREEVRLKRYSLGGAAAKLWAGAALRVLSQTPSARILWRIVRADLSVRLLRSKRERQWMRRLTKTG